MTEAFTRQVYYIGGFYMGGPAFYRATLVREAARYARVHGIPVTLEDGPAREGFVRHFVLTAKRPEGRVETRYALLRWEDIVLDRLARPWRWRIAASVATFADYTAGGMALRMLRLSRRFGLIWLFPFVFYAGALLLASLLGLFVDLVFRGFGFTSAAFVLGLAAAAGTIVATGALGRRSYAYLFLNNWIFSREIALDRAPDLWERLDLFADHIAAGLGRADEVVIVGHSFGASLAPLIAARALALAGTGAGRLTLLTLGASPAVIGLHPAASRFREGLREAASRPEIAWTDVFSSYDAINLKRFDPVAGLGLAGPGARSPHLVDTRFSRRMRRGAWGKLGLMRLHMQFIKAAESGEGYDYIGLVTGAGPMEEELHVQVSMLHQALPPPRAMPFTHRGC